MEVVDETSHALFVDRPEAFNRVLEAFRDASLVEVRLRTGKRNQIRIQARLRGDRGLLDDATESAIARAVLDQLFGVGRLQPLLDDPDVSDIEINGCDQVYVPYRDGSKVPGDAVADSDAELIELIRAWERLACWAAAGQLAAIAELARRRPRDLLDRPSGPTGPLSAGGPAADAAATFSATR